MLRLGVAATGRAGARGPARFANAATPWRLCSNSARNANQATSVELHKHRYDRKSAKWVGIDGLAQRTQGSLIDQTLREMESDPDFQLTAKRLKELGQEKITVEERKKRARALDELGVPSFWEFVEKRQVALQRTKCEVFQINIGLFCNQACSHCHVESSPKRTEMMDRRTAQRCLDVVAASPSVRVVDITGGAPELNPEFRFLVEGARALGKEVIDRCNLTVLTEPGQEDLAGFLSSHQVRVVASLPCYSPKNVNLQRGSGVFDRSIAALRALNDEGYGVDPALKLDLVYNPVGPFLPPPQAALEAKYKEELMEQFGIVFNSLFTMTNMPIKRFADFLHRQGNTKQYMDLLVQSFNPDTVPGLMCTNHVSVDYKGDIFDCDFNQQLAMPMQETIGANKTPPSVFSISNTDELLAFPILTDNHCFGCTAGQGSS